MAKNKGPVRGRKRGKKGKKNAPSTSPSATTSNPATSSASATSSNPTITFGSATTHAAAAPTAPTFPKAIAPRITKIRKEKKAKRTILRQDDKAAGRFEATKYSGLEWDNEEDIRVIYARRHPDLRAEMTGNSYTHDHEIFERPGIKWTRIGGKGSGLVYVLDAETHELVSAVRISEHSDMSAEDRTKYTEVFDYFQMDRSKHRAVKSNGAQVAGVMRAMGWRVSMESKSQSFGTYAPHDAHDKEWLAHAEGGGGIHKHFANGFSRLAPKLYQNQAMEHAVLGVPAYGFDFDDKKDWVFCSNLAYTRDGFANKGHCDRDISTYTFGIGGNVTSNGKLASFHDGYEQQGGFFFISDYGIIIDYSKIDGVCEQIWQGPKHVHGTVGGVIKKGFTRYGSSAQINNNLAGQVKDYLMNPEGKYVLGDFERFKQARQNLRKEKML